MSTIAPASAKPQASNGQVNIVEYDEYLRWLHAEKAGGGPNRVAAVVHVGERLKENNFLGVYLGCGLKRAEAASLEPQAVALRKKPHDSKANIMARRRITCARISQPHNQSHRVVGT